MKAVRIESFEPVADKRARVLILGSMPGRRSLELQQYYAHPRNSFWQIMSELFDIDPARPYPDRLEGLQQHHIALWDVLKSCRRPGSLDARIDPQSIHPNPVYDLLQDCPDIHHIFFNGAKAEQVFNRHVQPTRAEGTDLTRIRLPSTSPAHAGITYLQKLEAWRTVAKAAFDSC